MSSRLSKLASRTFWSLTVLTLGFSAACFAYSELQTRQALSGYPPETKYTAPVHTTTAVTSSDEVSAVTAPTTLAPTTTTFPTTTTATTASDEPAI
jgi:hypothetical protein